MKAAVLGAALVLAGAAGASAASSGVFGGSDQPPATRSAHITPHAFVDTTTESKYTPITPCRIVDTRIKGGPIKAGRHRPFKALGSTSFAGQGGTSCDIPTSATAVTGSIISVNAAGGGHADLWATGTTDPGASFINFAPHPTISASGTIPMGTGANNFEVGVYSSATEVVIQLTGYYVPPLAAHVNSDASLNKGSRVTSTQSLSTGRYEIDFDRDVSNCYYAVSSFSLGVTLDVQPRGGVADGVYVGITDNSGTFVNTAFYLTVTC